MKSPEFGEAYEHYLFHELKSFVDYTLQKKLRYWRSTTGYEVDFILNDRIAIEAKAKEAIGNRDTKGLRAIKEEKKMSRYLLVCLEKRLRKLDYIEVLPWDHFLKNLWAGEYS